MQIIVVNSYVNMKSIIHSCALVVFAIITYIATNKTSKKFSMWLKVIYDSSVLVFI